MNVEANKIIQTLERYGKNRQDAVNRGLESSELSALLVEKYAVGLVDAIRTLQLDIDVNVIASFADDLCKKIDPNTLENRQLRYTSVSKLDLSEPRKSS